MEAVKENKIWHQGSLGDEDDARTSNTCIGQRKRAIPHSTMKNNLRNIIECCNNTHQGVSRTDKQYACNTRRDILRTVEGRG